jgi:hypothetical protein
MNRAKILLSLILTVGLTANLHAQRPNPGELQEDLFFSCTPFKAHAHDSSSYPSQRSLFISIFDDSNDSASLTDWRAIVYAVQELPSISSTADSSYDTNRDRSLNWESIKKEASKRRVIANITSIRISRSFKVDGRYPSSRARAMRMDSISGRWDEQYLTLSRLTGIIEAGRTPSFGSPPPEGGHHTGEATDCERLEYEELLEQIEVLNQETREWKENVIDARRSLMEQQLF